MNNTFFFLRHAETEKNPSVNAVEWGLSASGMERAKKLAESGVFDEVDMVISSEEKKAFQTAKAVAEKLGQKIIKIAEFNEVKRGDSFLAKEEFEKLKREKLEDLDCKKDGGESAREALERFESGLEKVNKLYEGKKILIVSHGTILSLYFAKIADKMDSIYDRWQKTQFCAWGKVKDGNLEKDICRSVFWLC